MLPHEDTANAPVIAHTAFPAGTADKSGFDEFLAKPIEPFDLVETVASFRKSA